jgi:hypothetical protein
MRALCAELEQSFVAKKARLQRISFKIRCVNAGLALRLGAARKIGMSTILIVVLVILLLGGFGGYHGYSQYGVPGLGGVLGLVLIVLVVLWLVAACTHDRSQATTCCSVTHPAARGVLMLTEYVPRFGLPLVSSLSRAPAPVLIVEDEVLVRVLGVGLFADAGFRPIEAADGEEMLEILSADSEVQLLFTDVNLPGSIDGLALARQVRDR